MNRSEVSQVPLKSPFIHAWEAGSLKKMDLTGFFLIIPGRVDRVDKQQELKTETTKQKLMALVVAFPRQRIHCSFVDETNFAKSPCRVGKVLWVELLQDFWLCQIHLTNPEVCGDVGAKYDQHYQHCYSVASGVAKIIPTKISNNYIRFFFKKKSCL